MLDPDTRDGDEVLLRITTLTGTVIVLNVPTAITVMEIRKTLQHYAECCYVTQYALVTREGVVLSDLVTLGQQWTKGKGVKMLQMVFTPYSHSALREHIVQLRELHGEECEDFALTCASIDESGPHSDPLSYPNISRASLMYSMAPPDEPSEISASLGHTDILSANPKHAAILATTAADTPPLPPQPLIATHMAVPTSNRRLRGDLMYFTVSFGKQTYGVAGTHDGFHLLASHDFTDTTKTGDTYQTLLGLLYNVIPGQRERYEELIRVRVMNSRHEDGAVFPPQKWLVKTPEACYRDAWQSREYEYSITQAQDPRFSQRNWCTQWVECESAIDQIFSEFVASCRQAVMLAVDGSLMASEAASRFEDQVFFFHGIAVSFCSEVSTINSPSWAAAHKDLLFSKYLSPYLSKENIHTLPTCCVDYHGYRAWCVGVSFEIFDKHGLSKLAYRQGIEPDRPMTSDTVRNLLGRFEKSNLITLRDADNELPSVFEGRDGRMYIENTHYLLGRHDEGLARPEMYEKHNGMLHRCDETSVSSCGTNELASSENSATDVTDKDAVSFQTDLLARDIIDGTVSLGDSASLTKTFHDRGVPMRMVGRVYHKLPEDNSDCSRLMLECVLRGAKRGLRDVLREHRGGVVSPAIADYLNGLFVAWENLTEVQEAVKAYAEGHFGMTGVEVFNWRGDGELCWYVLRGVCLKVGLVIAGREFEWGAKKVFKKGDVGDVVPVCYRLLPATNRNDEEMEMGLCMEQAMKLSELKDDRNTCRALSQLIHELTRHHGCDSPYLIPPLHSLALSLLHLSTPHSAAPLYARAANIAFLTSGSGSPDYMSSLLNYTLCAVKMNNAHHLQVAHAALSEIQRKKSKEHTAWDVSKYLEAVAKKMRKA
eukprot:TRINITY_DN25317_c0_g1_i1.p1 TRINITY_DN25317_c0_g1~~TRINITY_DN25317_c0_g1_i1.p1  ORF type:complete len:894 (+),score=158.84 TRINITY_DN25317_c0_g1_i1:36-2684(+)